MTKNYTFRLYYIPRSTSNTFELLVKQFSARTSSLELDVFASTFPLGINPKSRKQKNLSLSEASTKPRTSLRKNPPRDEEITYRYHM